MIEFLIQRAAISLVTLFLISLIVFTGVRMIPGDPARVMAGTEADAAGLEEIREKYGLNDPMPVQYLALGRPGAPRRPRRVDPHPRARASARWRQKLPITLELACLSLLIALAHRHPGRGARRRAPQHGLGLRSPAACRSAALSIPNFWLGIMLILLLSVRLGWLPASGFVPLWRGSVGEPQAHAHAGLRARHRARPRC